MFQAWVRVVFFPLPIYLCDLQGQSQKTSLVSLSWNYNCADQWNSWRQSLSTSTQEASPKVPAQLAGTWDSSGPGAQSYIISRSKVSWLNFPVAIDFYIDQTYKFTHAISVCLSEAGVCFVANHHWMFLRPQFCTVLEKELYHLVCHFLLHRTCWLLYSICWPRISRNLEISGIIEYPMLEGTHRNT